MRHTNLLDWNEQQIDWQPYEEGLAQARQTNKPILFAYYTHWCPDCHHISGYFHDAEVVALARQFVMIWANRDDNPQAGAAYDIDGTYVPRILLMTSNGEVYKALDTGRTTDIYFYDQAQPDRLIQNMNQALKNHQGV